ncbi:MAG TPA: hypothetical protein PLK03_07120 [Termitinemataceae bacterium]|nr:hypothetical protein [Termitinemataceae bacterium]
MTKYYTLSLLFWLSIVVVAGLVLFVRETALMLIPLAGGALLYSAKHYKELSGIQNVQKTGKILLSRFLSEEYQEAEPHNKEKGADGSFSLVYLCEQTTGLVEKLNQEKQALQDEIELLHKKYAELEKTYRSLSELCPVHLPLDIGEEWREMIYTKWGNATTEALHNLERLKSLNDQNQNFIKDVQNEFGAHQEAFSRFSHEYRSSLEEYTSQAQKTEENILNKLEYSAKRIADTFDRFYQVMDVTEKIKMISLNLSIEASRLHGANPFAHLARELRKLAQSTEETLGSIGQSIRDTHEFIQRSQKEQKKDLLSLGTILEELQKLIFRFEETSEKLSQYMQKAVNHIEQNQGEQKNILLHFFTTLQNLAIVKEELDHQAHFIDLFLREVNDYMEKHFRFNQSCPGPNCPQRRKVLAELASLATTDGERRMVNQLFKEMLGEDREVVHGTLSVNQEQFISFN